MLLTNRTKDLFDCLYYPDNSEYEVYQDEDNSYLDIFLAGYKKENLKLELDNYVLTVSGTKKDKSYKKSFVLSKNTDIEKISSKFEDGVLSIKLPQKEKTVKLLTID